MVKKRNSLSNDLVRVAGVHYVVSQLSMRGLIAMPTIRNTSGIDILVTDPSTNASANLQVKSSQNTVTFWPTSMPDRCLRGKNCFYVFVRYLPKEKKFQAFLQDSEKVVKRVTKIVRYHKQKGRKVFPNWPLPKYLGSQRKLEEKWNNWRPPL